MCFEKLLKFEICLQLENFLKISKNTKNILENLIEFC